MHAYSPRFFLSLVFILLVSEASSQQCSLCGPDNQLPSDSLLRENNGLACSELFNRLNNGSIEEGSEDCKLIQLLSIQTGCCDSDTADVPKVCSVCPDGGPYMLGVDIPGARGRPDMKCGDLEGDASFLDYMATPGDCSDTFLQRSAAWCGCAGTEVKCPLCPDGSRPPDPFKTEKVLYGWDCNVFEYIHSLLNDPECHMADEILEFDAAAFCCPHTADSPGICEFCPEGKTVTDPEKLISSEYGPLTCGDIEESMRLIPTARSCLFTRNKFDTDICCSSSAASTTSNKSILRLHWMSVIFMSAVVLTVS